MDCHWPDPVLATESASWSDGGEPPDYWVSVDLPPPAGEPARRGVVQVETALGLEPVNGGGRVEPVIVAKVLWRPPGGAGPAVAQRMIAPVGPRDRRRDIQARCDELTLHAIRSALTDAAPGAQAEGPLGGDGDGGAPLRPLTRLEYSRWALRQILRRGARQLHVRVLAKRAFLLVALLVFRPARDLVRSRRLRHPVRIFTFHRVTDLCRDSLTASRATFTAQLRYIRRTHEVVTLDTALKLLAAGTPLERPVAVLTFDDAYRSVYDFAAPVMTELGVPGCCFAPTAYVGSEDRFPWDGDNPVLPHLGVMGWEELRRLKERGWTIGAHSSTHARLAECDEAALRHELEEPLGLLRRRLEIERVSMAYPFGGPNDIDARGLRQIELLGFSACLANYGGENFAPASPFRLSRIDIGGDHDVLTWMGRVHGIDTARWFHRIVRPAVPSNGSARQPTASLQPRRQEDRLDA